MPIHHIGANRLIEPIHHRMPAVLDERAAEDRMNSDELKPLRLKLLLVPAPDDTLIPHSASSLVNGVNNDGPDC